MLNAAIIAKVLGTLIVLVLIYVFWLHKYVNVDIEPREVIRWVLFIGLAIAFFVVVRKG